MKDLKEFVSTMVYFEKYFAFKVIFKKKKKKKKKTFDMLKLSNDMYKERGKGTVNSKN